MAKNVCKPISKNRLAVFVWRLLKQHKTPQNRLKTSSQDASVGQFSRWSQGSGSEVWDWISFWIRGHIFRYMYSIHTCISYIELIDILLYIYIYTWYMYKSFRISLPLRLWTWTWSCNRIRKNTSEKMRRRSHGVKKGRQLKHWHFPRWLVETAMFWDVRYESCGGNISKWKPNRTTRIPHP